MAELDADDKKMVTEILTFFYPDNLPRSVNDKLADLAARMLYAALKKSKALDLVPRPPGSKPGISWLIKQAVKTFWRKARKQKIYSIARTSVARDFRSEYELAKMDI
ncbi:MAG: hypothetical protein ACE5K2_05955 [Candidatus Zixiibacteriota bacterium]